MTTEALQERTTPQASGTGTGGLRTDGRPTTTVPVIPLWERPHKGGRG
jgi:hypothetical protein